MRISRIQIENFRNFRSLDLELAGHAVIVGENKIGKSNLLHALRLVLDPSLPDASRQLRDEDFWDGLPRPLNNDHRITVSVDLVGFETNDDQAALLTEHLVVPEPMTARITYVFQPLATLDGPPRKEADYEFFIYGGGRPENAVGFEFRRRLPMDVLPALRDAEGDLAAWRRSPLRPLLDAAAAQISRDQLTALAQTITAATNAVTDEAELRNVVTAINDRVVTMVGTSHAVQTSLGFSPTDPDRLLRALRLFIDAGKRDIAGASLGSANILYLTLKALELDLLVAEGVRHHTFLGIEEPEAHIHPHLQRLVYRHFLRAPPPGNEDPRPLTILLTTHSPHIASVSPLRSIALLRKAEDGLSSEAVSTAALDLDPETIADLERYLDVTRGEILFAKGVILVEGEAERFLVPALARAAGIDFDELGITVCSVGGTNFGPYLALVGSKGLRLPVAVVTDGDPDNAEQLTGPNRAIALLKTLEDVAEGQAQADLLVVARRNGLFVGAHTLELDLFRVGAHEPICDALIALAPGPTAQQRATAWRADPNSLDADRFLKDVSAIGKGRFAQRLAGHILREHCPPYIAEAIEYVRARSR